MKRGCCPKEGLKRGSWTSQEDKLLSDYIKVRGLGKWRILPVNAGLNRCGKSCRLRWLNYLRPDIKRGNITEEEEELIIRLHKLLGNRWSLIAGRLPGRTDNEIKNYWNSYLRKKLMPENSEQQSSSITKKVSTEKPTAENKAKSEVNVIRTKAVRCTRPLSIDQLPNSSNGMIPTTSLDSEFLLAFNGQTAFSPSNINMDEKWIGEIMQKDSSHDTSTDSLQSIGNVEISFDEDNYISEWMSNGMNEGHGLCSFLDPDSWDS